MKIIIVGSGKVGFTISEQLTKEGHDIVVIDNSPEIVEKINNSLDVMALCGNGANLDVLKKAQAGKSDLLIACTDMDELNLLCCVIARKLGCKNTIARVRTPEYAEQMYFMKDEFALSMTINPELLAAREIFSLLEIPGVLKRDSFPKSQVEIVEICPQPGSLLDGVVLSELPKRLGFRALICAVERSGDVFIPNGDFTLKAGDRAYICGTLTEIVRILKAIGLRTKKPRNVLIIGGSKMADYLTGLLIANGYVVKVIERDPEKARNFAKRHTKARVICADGASHEVLKSENAAQMDAAIALTNIDEENIILSMYFESIGIPQVIGKVNRSEFAALVEGKGLDCVVNPKKLCANAIVGYVRAMQNTGDSSILTLRHLVDERVDALEFEVKEHCPYTGIRLKDVNLKSGILLACISRLGKIIIPGGSDTIEVGDTIIVISSSKKIILDLNDIFAEV